MRQEFVCWACGKKNEFETEYEKRFLLLIDPQKEEKREAYMVKCVQCGKLNRVEVVNDRA